MSIEPGEKIQTVHKSKTSQIVFQTIFHCRIRLGEADLHHSFSVQITIGISDLLNELPQPVLSRCRRIKPDAASLNECAVLSDDLYSVDKKDIKNIKVEGLILSGKKYESCRENVIKAVIRGMFSGNMA